MADYIGNICNDSENVYGSYKTFMADIGLIKTYYTVRITVLNN